MVVKGTNMNTIDKIKTLIENNGGYITRKDIDREGIPSIYLTRYVKKNGLAQIDRGFYAFKDWIVDPYLVFQYKYPQFIYSLVHLISLRLFQRLLIRKKTNIIALLKKLEILIMTSPIFYYSSLRHHVNISCATKILN